MRKLKRLGRISLAFLLALAMLLSCAGTVFAEVGGDGAQAGYFTLVAETDTEIVIEPVRVPYEAGATIGDALDALEDHTFTGLAQGNITEIDGVSASYMRSDQAGEYDLSAQASTVTVFRFSLQSGAPSSALATLIQAMGRYNDSAASQVDDDASAAYSAAVQGYLGVSDADALTLAQALNTAIDTAEQGGGADGITVHLTLSDDGEFVTGADGTVMARVPITVDYFDLAQYGLEDFYRYEADPETGQYTGTEVLRQPTVLHLLIQALETYYLEEGETLEVGSDALNISGNATSMYMMNFWGHDQNLMYFVDHQYPLMSEEVGATADWILLEDGMEIDIGMFSDWNFWMDGAFASFSPSEMNVEAGEEFTLTMQGTATMAGMTGESQTGTPMVGETVRYTQNLNGSWTDLTSLTDEYGKITLSFDTPGTYYISAGPTYETYESESPCVAPPIAVVNVEQAAPKYAVSFTVDDGENPVEGASVEVVNERGMEMTAQDGVYQLKDGTYTYTVTAQGYAAATDSFTVNGAGQIVNVTLQQSGLLSELYAHVSVASSAATYEMSPAFSPDVHEYTVKVLDAYMAFAVRAYLSDDAAPDATITAKWTNTSGEDKSVTVNPGQKKNLTGFLASGGVGGTCTIEVDSGEDHQVYTLHVERVRTLSALSVVSGGTAASLTPDFNRDTLSYSADVLGTVQEVTVAPTAYGSADKGYSVSVGGQNVAEGGNANVALTGEETEISIVVSHTDGTSRTYMLTVVKQAVAQVSFDLTPGDAIVFMKDSAGQRILPDA